MRMIKLVPVVALLVGSAVVPATAQAIEGEATAEAAAEYYNGQAYGAAVDLLGAVVLPAQPDTGEVSTSEDVVVDPGCTVSVESSLLDAGVLCPSVSVDTATDTVVSETTIEEASVNVLGTPAIIVEDLTATAVASCDRVSGDVDLTLRIGNETILVDDPNVAIQIPGGEIVVNKQVPTEMGTGIAVTAVVVKLDGLADITIGHAEASAHGCMSTPPES
ncbi:choice-of-anchor P family protein [Myceligenerans halotolerans]